jgi:hypothetical protein
MALAWKRLVEQQRKRRSGIIAPLLVAASALLLASCAEPDAPDVSAKHPWINPPTVVDDKAVTLPAWLIYRVPEAVRAEAITALEVEAYIQISPGMASHYTQEDVRVPPTMRPFLIRALTAGESEITVIQSMTGLWTQTRGKADAQLEYSPLVVLIDPTPRDIFVTVE